MFSWVGFLGVQKVLGEGFQMFPQQITVNPFSFMVWSSFCNVVNLRTANLRPHVILSARQRTHVSGWGQRMAFRAGFFAKFLKFHSRLAVPILGECSLLHTLFQMLLLVPARHYRLLGWAECSTIPDV